MTVNPTDHVRNTRISLEEVQAAKRANVHSQESPASDELTRIVRNAKDATQTTLSEAQNIMLETMKNADTPVVELFKTAFKDLKNTLGRLEKMDNQKDLNDISNKVSETLSYILFLVDFTGQSASIRELPKVLERTIVPKFKNIVDRLEGLPDKINPILTDALNRANDQISATRKKLVAWENTHPNVDFSEQKEILTKMLGVIDDIRGNIRSENLFAERVQKEIRDLKDKCNRLLDSLRSERSLPPGVIDILQNAKALLDDAIFNTTPLVARRSSRRSLQVIGW